MAFAISARRIKGQGANARYEAEPAVEASYLITPDDAVDFLPAHALKGASGKKAWTKIILNTFGRDADNRLIGNLVFLVHGFNVDTRSALRAHRDFEKRLRAAGLPHTLVSFDWPSAGSFLNYLEDSSDAYKAAPMLVESGIALFATTSTPDCRVKVHVVAHSMGCFVTREAFRQSRGHLDSMQGSWGVTQLVLIAADISAGSVDTELAADMFGKAQRVTSYFSKYDAALATSNVKRFASSPRLGRHGSRPSTMTGIVDVDCSDRWLSFSRTDGSSGFIADLGLSHTWYFEDSERFFPDLVTTLIGDLDRAVMPTRDIKEGMVLLKR